MKIYKTHDIKNVVLLGAPGSGKTTLAEAMAFEGKVIERRGSIAEKNTLSDNTELEHTNERSIYSTIISTEFQNYKLNIIDTPGSDDFCGNLFAAFKVADVGVMLLNAQEGFEAGTEIQARYARNQHKPIIAVVNQLDLDKANWETTMESLIGASRVKPVLVQYPMGVGEEFDAIIDVLTMKMYKCNEDGECEEHDIPESELERATELNTTLVEASAENDDALMELYFEKGTLTQDEMRSGLKLGLANRDLIPVFCTSGAKNFGTRRLMEFIKEVAPGPIKAPNFRTEDDEEIFPSEDAPVAMFVFKCSMERHIGEIIYFRLIRGTLKEGDDIVNARTGNREKVGQLYVVAGKNRKRVAEMHAGDIGCTVKLRGVKTNDTLCDSSDIIKIAPIVFPQAKYRAAIKAVNSSDDERLGEALNRITYEDPTVLVAYSKESRQTIIRGQGEHQINIIKRILADDFKIEVELSAPRISYRETITRTSAASYRHRRQSGGAGQFGEVYMIIEPYVEGMPEPETYKVDGRDIKVSIRGKEEIELEWGGKLIFYNSIVGGAIDTRFLPAILKGVMERMEEGPLTGSYARDIRVIVYDGKMHPVDSNEVSFMIAGRTAFRDAFRNAAPQIMEPLFSVEILTPTDRMGDVMSDLQNRRAIIEGMTSDSGFDRLTARVPLAELYRYSTTLSSITSGRATYVMEFHSFQQVPHDVQERLLAAYKDEMEAE